MNVSRAVCSTMITLVLSVAALAPAAQQVHAQASQPSADSWTQYNAQKKNEFAAVGLEALLPVLGHAYAGDAGRGLLPALVSVGGFVVMIAGSADLNAGMTSLGALAYLGGRGWGIYSAYATVEDRNAGLRQQLNLSIRPGTQAGWVQIGISLPVR